MKTVFCFMTFVFTALISFPAFSGGGGISGGSKMITVQVCDIEMPGQCQTIRYLDRMTEQDHYNALNQKGECYSSMGEATNFVPCTEEQKTYKIPKFLRKLNEIFGGAGATPPTDDHGANSPY